MLNANPKKPMRYFQLMRLARKRIVSPYRSAFMAPILGALLTACSLLCAQTGGTGAISGAITDPSSAVLAGAQVKVTDVGTGYTRTSQSNDHGLYLVSLLPPGRYKLEVTKQGFKLASSSDVQVIVAETTVLNVRMATGAVTESITVSASSVDLQTESSELGRVTDSEMLENLPLVTRNFTQVIGLNPGVSQEVNNASEIGRGGGSQDANPGGGSIMSQGATSTDNNFQMNGLTINDIQGSWIYSSGIPAPNPDTIQEFKVQTALFDATTGRNAGANVDVITKAGTNDYHASLFEYFRNEDLNANDWFANHSAQPRGILRQNQYGFTAGGPLIKNKLLLFGSWQGTKQYNSTDPSNHKFVYLPPLTNDRSAAGLGAVFAGDAGYLGPLFGTINADGSNISPQALALFQAKLPNGQYVIPTPQSIDPSAPLEVQGSAYLNSPGFFTENQWMVNADYLVSDRNKIAVRYFGALSNVEWTTLYQTEGFPLFQPEHFDVASIGDTYTLSPSLVNQFVVGLHRSTSNQSYGNAFTFSSLGMNVPAEDNAYPNLWIVDDGFQTGTTSALRFLQEEYQLADTLSWVKGKHQLTFGGGITSGRDNMSKFDFEAYVLPLTWADFLLGQSYLPYGVPYSNIYETYEGIGAFQRDWRYKDANAFIQDNYRIAKRLTLNLGLRYERIGDLGSANGGGNVDVSKINPNPPATGSLDGYVVNSNYHGPPLPAGVIQGKNTFGFNGNGQNTWNPRFGFSWLLPGTERFVLRGGIGVYHTTTEGQMNLLLCAEAPTGIWSVLTGTYNAASTDASPFPAAPAFPVFTPYSPYTEFTLAALAMDWRPPTTYHYSLGLQSRLPGGAILDVAYAGARDLHSILGRTINQAALASPTDPIRGQTTNTVANIPLRAPYLGWTANTMYYFGTDGEAWYNSLQASLTQKLKHGFQYQAAYTWQRLLSPVPGFTTGSNEFGPTGDQTQLRAHESGYGPDYNVRPQRFVLSAYYALPSPAKSRPLLATTLGGWSIATATVIQDGQQSSITFNNIYNAYGITSDRASYAPGCTAQNVSTKGSPSQRVNNYINTACFTAPAVIGADGVATGFGNTPNGILRDPYQAVVDLSLSKSQRIRWPKEGASVQLRADFFNALNHPNFAAPDNAYTTTPSAFGKITATSTNPRVIQLALRFAF
jgi:Carboxypeptidase regulatory-like domain/TonB dependent receptor